MQRSAKRTLLIYLRTRSHGAPARPVYFATATDHYGPPMKLVDAVEAQGQAARSGVSGASPLRCLGQV